jgi:membrane-bound ClpP family serine protease
VVGSAFLFVRENEILSVNPIVAFFSSGLLAAFCWVVAVKFLDTLVTRPTHDLGALIGQVGEARTEIHDEGDGSVQVNGELWSARSENKIVSGSHIRVIRREGFLLVVEKVE